MTDVLKIYRPTPEEKAIIRECARRDAGFRGVEINPSTKINMKTNAIAFNVALISDDPDFADCDLCDNAYTWADFTRGVALTDDGRAIVDFYVYNRGRSPELQTNVTIYVEGGRLVRVDATGKGTMWVRGD